MPSIPGASPDDNTTGEDIWSTPLLECTGRWPVRVRTHSGVRRAGFDPPGELVAVGNDRLLLRYSMDREPKKGRVDLDLFLPGTGRARLKGRVVARLQRAESTVELMVELCGVADTTRRTLASHLFATGDPRISPASLRAAGLPVPSLAAGVQHRTAASHKELQQIGALRQLAYTAAGKTGIQPLDEWDVRAENHALWRNGVPVSSLRLIINGADDEGEHEHFATLPSSLPPKTEMVEITRVCTHPDFRGGDLLILMLQRAAVACAATRRRWVLGCANEKLLPLYRRIGFRTIGVRYQHPQLGEDPHEIFLGDLESILSIRILLGRTMNPIVWESVWADAAAEIMMSRRASRSRVQAVQWGAMSAGRPILRAARDGLDRGRRNHTRSRSTG